MSEIFAICLFTAYNEAFASDSKSLRFALRSDNTFLDKFPISLSGLDVQLVKSLEKNHHTLESPSPLSAGAGGRRLATTFAAHISAAQFVHISTGRAGGRGHRSLSARDKSTEKI
ncbi:hypothetical protein EVAR_22795_1 [Eumeta japonica]|uniref:Uncharacterized protein n=1 Tax=Eumeta variegata TaxID=151549 RepID=A0A4C1VHW0_EUMVA|nr:hypothetical protein EVAR_22795_1 [Eumeta japonica]